MDSVGTKRWSGHLSIAASAAQAERKHLEDDGAGNSIPALSIEANAVVIRS